VINTHANGLGTLENGTLVHEQAYSKFKWMEKFGFYCLCGDLAWLTSMPK
jgi:hypothetical protein